MPTYGLDVAVVGHQIGNEHDVPDVHRQTLFAQGSGCLVDAGVPGSPPTQYVVYLLDGVGRSPLSVHMLLRQHLPEVGACGVDDVLATLVPQDGPLDTVQALDDRIPGCLNDALAS